MAKKRKLLKSKPRKQRTGKLYPHKKKKQAKSIKKSHKVKKTVRKSRKVKKTVRKSRKVKKTVRKSRRRKHQIFFRGKPVAVKLAFLEKNAVPYRAYRIPHQVRLVYGEVVVGAGAETLRKLVEKWRNKFERGITFGRLMINFFVSRGKGKSKLVRTVGTHRVFLGDSNSWQELLSFFNQLTLTLYDYDGGHFGEDNANIRITVKNVVLELIHTVVEGSIELP